MVGGRSRGRNIPITSIVVYNRTDGDLGKRLDGFTLKVLDKNHKVVFEKTKIPAPAEKGVYEVGSESPELLVRHAAMNALLSVRGKETDTFKALAPFVKKDADREAAIRALQRIPVTYWPKEEAKPLLDDMLAYVRTIPVAERTSPAVLDALQLADSLASMLPPDEAKAVRKELGELGVRVIRLSTLPDQMLYDKDRIVVQAGKPVEILFENDDLMPHNFVVLQPGSLEEIGTANEAAATDPGAMARGYVPQSPKVLLASRLLHPRDRSSSASRPRPSRASIPTSAPIPATGGGCTAPCTSSRTWTSTTPTRRATWPRTRCRSRTRC